MSAVLTEKELQVLRSEYYRIEAAVKDLQQRSYSIRVILDRLSGPAPSGGKKALSHEKRTKLVLQRKQKIVKKAASVASPTAIR